MTLTILEYTLGQEQDQTFITNLSGAIIAAKERSMENHLTDSKSYQNIWVAHAQHLLLIYPALWNYCEKILSFAKSVHQMFQNLESLHIEPLYKAIEEIYIGFFTPEVVKQKIVDLNNKWNDYKLFYGNFRTELDALIQESNIINNAFNQLYFRASEERWSLINISRDTYQLIIDQLNGYKSLDDHVSAYFNNFRGIYFDERKDFQDLWVDSSLLLQNVRTTNKYANKLIYEWVNLILSL